jgi:putative spermidine/putrescine transport system permease protein
MTLSRFARVLLRVWAGIFLVVVYVPLAVILINSFNSDRAFAWPPPHLTTHWWSIAWQTQGVRAALLTSVEVGLAATALALLLGTAAALALARYQFFGQRPFSLVLILPIALPGIVTGIALESAFQSTGVPFGILTIIIGHATFCVVMVYNNVVARLRRMSTTAEEASMDLGAGIGRTFGRVTLPSVRAALVAGALLAFALSFDEIVVTTFTAGAGTQTLPLWIFNNLARPNLAPVVDVVAVVVILLSLIPVYLAQRLSATAGETDPAAAGH